MSRRISRRWHVSAALCAAPVAAVSFFRAVPAPWPAPVVQLVAFTPWLVLPAGAALLLSLPGRRPWAVLPAGALLALQLLWLFPPDRVADRLLGRQGDQPPGQGTAQLPATELKVMTLNSWKGKADAAEVVRLVRDNGVALLAIQELTPALEKRLDAEGLGALLQHRFSRPLDGAGGSGVYSSRPIVPVDSVAGTAFYIPTVQLDLGGDPTLDAGLDPDAGGRPLSLTVTNVHTKAPVWGRAGQWRSELAAMGRLADRPGNVLLLGDFNATLDHAEFRQMLEGGPDGAETGGSGADGPGTGGPRVDAGAAALARLVPTWPMDGPPLPGVVIDHIVTSPQVRSSGYSVVPVAGTDHAAVLATLSVPAGG